MTYARTIAAAVATTVGLVLVPAISTTNQASASAVETAVVTSIEPLAPVSTDEIIEGVRVVADTDEHAALVSKSLDKFAAAGFEITNTEVRYDEDACTGSVGFHTIEDGHHVVVLCTDSEWTLLHELGHVWSALYLDDDLRSEWLDRRGLRSWRDAEDVMQGGTEHAAEIIAFGLYDTWHTPRSIDGNDVDTLLDDFEWLFGMAPLHRQPVRRASMETTARVTVIVANDQRPADSAPEADDEAVSAPIEYRFPLACGFPRWHSRHGGYGYEDPRDWTHVGVDLYAFEGTPVVSPVHGTVVAAGWNDVSGWNVTVQDRRGYRHVMVHLRRPPVVAVGMTVASGQRVGDVGRSGNASGGGPHLHYEIRLGEDTIDPMEWLNETTGINVEQAPRNLAVTDAPALAACETRA